MMKKIKIGLLPRIILAIALGIAFGNILPGGLVRIFVTFNGIFSEFLGFIIPLIILGLVTPAIADIGKEAGKMLVVTTLIAYGATLFSGFLSYFTGITFFPSMITPGASIEQISEAHDIVPFFTVAIPPVMNVMTSLILAFTLGLGIAHLNTTALKDVCNDFKDIIIKTIQVIILPLLPIYIFGIFLNMTHSGQVMNVFRSSSRLSELSSCCIFSCSFSNTPLRLCLSAAIRFVCWGECFRLISLRWVHSRRQPPFLSPCDKASRTE